MERYEKYKDSGIAWLGEIPEHWKIKKLKYLIKSLESGVSVNSIDIPVSKGSYGILKTSCVYKYVFEPQENKEILSLELDRAKVNPKKGAIIISRMNTPELVGASGYVEKDYDYLFLPDRLWQTVFFENLDIHTKWLSFVLKSSSFRELLSILATGTSSSMKNLGQEEFLNIKISFSPPEEQRAIAAYLDRKTAEIDQLIAQKERLIELYEEEKTAIINEAVTKGINPDVKLKPTAINWLGDIPEHWDIQKIRNVTTYFKGLGFKSSEFNESGIPIVKASDIKNGSIQSGSSYIAIDNQQEEFEKVRLASGDIVVSTVGSKPDVVNSAVGQVGIISHNFNRAYLNQNIVCIRPLSFCKKEYLNYCFKSKYIRCKFDAMALWIANQAYLQIDSIREISIPFPPLEEQKAISEYIEKETAHIDAKIAKTKRIIELQKEYRTALISEAVTGKIKVPQLDQTTN
ncbi:MAG: restriction endonuclease subunit S [Snowella sp.]|nr:restriction endonuclease subunit S [Snowella sp.]